MTVLRNTAVVTIRPIHRFGTANPLSATIVHRTTLASCESWGLDNVEVGLLGTSNAPPELTSQPVSKVVWAGSGVSFEVVAWSAAPLSYQWRLDGVDLVDEPPGSGSRTSGLQISDVGVADFGSYTVIMSDALGAVRSASVDLSTASPVLFARVEWPDLVVTWNDAGQGMALQQATSLNLADWEDVPESEWTNTMNFPMTNPSVFFRLTGQSRLVWIPPGDFVIGSPPYEVGRDDQEGRQMSCPWRQLETNETAEVASKRLPARIARSAF